MTEGRFSSLEIDEYKSPREGMASGGAESPGEGRKHFVEQIRDADYYMKQTGPLALAGEHEKALRAYAAALGENPLLLDAWVGQVRMLLELGEYPEAVLWADKAMERFPDNPQLLASKSIALYRTGHHRQARGMNDVALQKKGEFEIVWLSRGELMLGDVGAASTECFAHAQRLSTNRATTMMHIGGLYLRNGHHGQALSTLREASREMPQASWVWYQLGRAQTEVGDYEQARISFAQAHKLNPRNETYETAVREQPRRHQGWLQKLFGGLFSK